MSLLERLSTRVKGALNDLADKTADPASEARQLNRDFDGEIRGAESGFVEVKAQYNMEVGHRDALAADVQKWQTRAEKAVAASDDGLAREALAEKAKVAAQLADQEAVLAKFKPKMDEVEAHLKQLRDQKAELERRSSMIEATTALNSARDKATSITTSGKTTSVTDRFDQLEAKVSKDSARADARDEIAHERSGGDLEDKFKALDRAASTSSIDDELAKIKQQVGK